MSIDPKTLPPKYQAQITQKLLQNQREKAAGSPDNGHEKPRKYHNTPDERNGPYYGADGGAEWTKIRFDSKAEARRYDELMLLRDAGKIRNLKLQPQFTLVEAYTTPEGKHVRAMRYVADFSYDRASFCDDGDPKSGSGWQRVVEDVKSKATKTREYQMKKKLLREQFGIEITEIE